MNLHVNGMQLRKKTLWILGLIAAGSISSQFAAINHFLSYHPKLAPLGGLVFSALCLIHNPRAEAVVTEALSDDAAGATSRNL